MQLPILEHTLTPEQAFGAASTLVAPGSTIGSSANYGALFQIAVLVIGFIYTFFIVRYWDFLRYFIIGALGFHQGSDEKAHINPAEKTNIEVVMIVLGLVTLSLCSLRAIELYGTAYLTTLSSSTILIAIVGAVFGSVTLMLAYQYGAIYLSSAICERTDIGRALIGLKSLYLAVAFVAAIPFCILFLLWQSTPPLVAILGAGISCAVALILFVKETFLFFVGQKISILHWILYLCALEIFPVSLILAPILR
jgi:hypothetical protein